MPVLRLEIAPLQEPARYAALARALTQLMAGVLGKQAGLTAVVVNDRPAAQWFVGGAPVDRPAAFLEANITAGTNSPGEKARFIAEAHAELRRQLAPQGDLHPASYVIVREVPATDWGYDGLTQHARRQPQVQAVA
jgi:4-oxalocrotonate tautomerase